MFMRVQKEWEAIKSVCEFRLHARHASAVAEKKSSVIIGASATISETFHMKTAPQGDCSGRPSHSVSMTKALMLLYRTSSQVSPEIVPSHHLYTLVFLLQLAENTQVRL